MNFNEYQKEARKTAIYPRVGNNLWYPALGLAGESGEVAEKVKKVYRDSLGQVSEDAKRAIIIELGDAMWYISNLAAELGYPLEDVARINLEKLQKRADSGALSGSGDNR